MANHVVICLFAYPNPSFSAEEAAQRLLDGLEFDGKLTPTSWGLDEREHRDYGREQALRAVAAADSQDKFFFRRERAIKHSGYLSFGTLPFLSLDLDKAMPPSRWSAVEQLADRLASALQVRFAILHAFHRSPFPWTTEEERLQRWLTLAAQPVPVRFARSGPLGLGARTYFGQDILQMFGEERLLGAPGLVTRLDWGGIRLDLVDDTWNTSLPALTREWKRAMDYLAPAGATAAPVFEDDNRTVSFEPSPAWQAQLNR